jgi:hypothetical protein
MSTVSDGDIGLWVCAHGYSPDVLEYQIGGEEPKAAGCAMHGEPFIKRCPATDCPSPIYHPSDMDAKFHTPCRTKIPWAELRHETALALMEYDPFNSKLLGTKKKNFAFDKLVGERYFGQKPNDAVPAELTPDERQDLVVPPSERLPAERVRRPRRQEESLPNVRSSYGTGPQLSDPDLRPELVKGAMPDFAKKPRDMNRFIDREGTEALNAARRNRAKAEAEAQSGRTHRDTGPSGLNRLLGGIGAFVFGSMQNTVGTVVGAAIIVVIFAVCGVKLAVQ